MKLLLEIGGRMQFSIKGTLNDKGRYRVVGVNTSEIDSNTKNTSCSVLIRTP